MLKKSLVLTSLTLLLAVPSTQISGLSANADSTKKLKAAPKVLRGYWKSGSFLERITRNKIIYISKGYRPYTITVKWSTGFVKHSFLYDDGVHRYPTYMYHVSRHKFYEKMATFNTRPAIFHRVSHAKFQHLCKTWATNRA